jgi:ATP-binding cassette, subfamily F, member 3
MLQLNDLSKSFGGQDLFSGVNLLLGSKERVGLVGRNGSGKSTLFRMILGEEAPSSGDISIPKGYRIGSLKQHISLSQPTVLEEVCQYLSGDESYDHYKAEKILSGLGFTEEDFDKDPNSFSGGYQVRINLAGALVSSPNLLLLDEPTNYLDIVSLRWLRQFLRSFDGEVLIITHDRDFMDSVCTHIMGIHRKSLRKIGGNTSKFYEQLALDEEVYEKTRVNQEKKIKELQNFADRFRAKASKASQAQSKLKQIERMEKLDKLGEENQLSLRFQYEECPGKIPIEVKDVSFGFEETGTLFEDISFPIGRHDRIGIIGKNGRGKSTLLNVINGEYQSKTGEIKNHSKLKIGHFGQTNVERLHPNNSVMQEIQEMNPKLGNTQIRQICGAMLFEDTLAEKQINVLSGGEKARVMLGKILAKPTNVLFLDEPTNHLDMESIEVLADAIRKFEGAVVMVTHSEFLLKRLVNRLIVFRHGGAEYFRGGYREFLKKIGWDEDLPAAKKKENVKSKKENQGSEDSSKLRSLKSKLAESEEDIMKLEELLDKYNSLLNEKFSKGEEVVEVSKMIGKINKKIEEKFEEMEKISEKISQIS